MNRTTQLIAAASLAFALTAPAALAEQIGTSCADCPSYSGAYSIENTTGVTIHYQYRWGDKHDWKRMALQTGKVETHSYPLGADSHAKVPTPYVRFDRVGGDNAVEWKEYKMEFFATGYAGYGPAVNKTEPKRYVFRYASDGRTIDIKAQ
jgi:hypothetical protein